MLEVFHYYGHNVRSDGGYRTVMGTNRSPPWLKQKRELGLGKDLVRSEEKRLKEEAPNGSTIWGNWKFD